MSLYSAVTCYEEHGSHSENRALEDWTASVTVRCAWGDRHALVNDVLGNQRVWPHAAGPVAQTCAIAPSPTTYSVTGQGLNYIDALVTINYGVDKKDLIAESLEPTAEFLIQDYKRFRWESAGGEPILEAEAPGKILRGLNLVRTLYNIEGPLSSALLDLVGCCNEATYSSTLLGLTFDEETLLYQPPTLSRTITTSGTDGWTIGLKFNCKPEGWNKYWRQKTQQYEEIFDYESGTAYKSYPPDDFSDFLF